MICQNWWQNRFKFKQTRPPLHSYSSPNICPAFTPHVVAHLAKRYETKTNKKVLALIPKSGNQDIWYHLHHILIPQNDFRRMLCVRYSTGTSPREVHRGQQVQRRLQIYVAGSRLIAGVPPRNSMNVETLECEDRNKHEECISCHEEKNKEYIHCTDAVKWYCKLKCCKQTC